MFLKPTEHVILYNTTVPQLADTFPWIELQEDDLRRIHGECGIDVLLEMNFWHNTETALGVYDWSGVDRLVERARRVGMRLMLSAPNSVPQNFPEKWYPIEVDGRTFKGHLSYWHPEAEEHTQEYLRRLVARYSGPDVTIIHWGFQGGECYLGHGGDYYDPWARQHLKNYTDKDLAPLQPYEISSEKRLCWYMRDWLQESIISHMCGVQSILVKQHNEVWDNTHYPIAAANDANGGFACPVVLQTYGEAWPTARIWTAQFAYWHMGKTNATWVDSLLHDCDAHIIVEADFCKGLAEMPSTADRAIAGGLNHFMSQRWQGTVVSPVHIFAGETTLKPWMFEVMKRAVDAWRTARD